VPVPQGKVNVMIVEDDPDHAELVRRMIADQAAAGAISRFTDGIAALAFLRDAAAGCASAAGGDPAPLPDIIFLEQRLIQSGTLDVLAEIKHDARLKVIPVVVLAASLDPADAALAYRRHANSYLVMPARRESFDRMMNDVGCYWLARNRSSPVPTPP
jgi:CheY-like chemotaxis protein